MIDLPGLNGGSPIGFLAALGLLRVLTEDGGYQVQLGWRNGHAVLQGVEKEAILEALRRNMTGRAKALEFTWAESTRGITPQHYQTTVIQAGSDRRALGFLAGWGTETVLRVDGSITNTRLDMTSGQQKLLRDLSRLARTITPAAFERALFGGAYEPQSSFGLDPIAVRTHAQEPEAPTKSDPPGKPGLIWLAFESIPLHPVIPLSPTKATTIGWRSGAEAGYVWPLWKSPLELAEVRLLRALPIDRLPRRPGVTQIWASRYGTNGKYGMLLPARREY